jgi:copper chaperone CopZ
MNRTRKGKLSAACSRARSALLSLSLVALVLAATGCSGVPRESKSENSRIAQLQTTSIPVEGMSCVSCAARVKRALKGIEGVKEVEVSLERREAIVQFSPEKVSPERLQTAIDGLGYKAGKPRTMEGK